MRSGHQHKSPAACAQNCLCRQNSPSCPVWSSLTEEARNTYCWTHGALHRNTSTLVDCVAQACWRVRLTRVPAAASCSRCPNATPRKLQRLGWTQSNVPRFVGGRHLGNVCLGWSPVRICTELMDGNAKASVFCPINSILMFFRWRIRVNINYQQQ